MQAPAAEATALRDDHAVGRFVSALDLGDDFERRVLDVDEIVLEQSVHALVQGQALASEHQVGAAGQFGIEQFLAPVVEGQHLVLDRLTEKHLLQLGQHLRMLSSQGPSTC